MEIWRNGSRSSTAEMCISTARDAHGFEGVENGDARVRVGRRVDYDAVVDAIGFLDCIHDGALVLD